MKQQIKRRVRRSLSLTLFHKHIACARVCVWYEESINIYDSIR